MNILAVMATKISATSFFTRYRGDGWQVYLEDPGIALSSVLYICAGLRATGCLESRIALGLGNEPNALHRNALSFVPQPSRAPELSNALRNLAPEDSSQPEARNALVEFGNTSAVLNVSERNALAGFALSGVMGDSFTASGRALDSMDKSQKIAVAGQGVDDLHRRLFAMIDERISGWSKEQSQAMALAFEPELNLTQAEMASRLGITRQAVAARLHSAGYAQIAGAGADFAKTFGSGETR